MMTIFRIFLKNAVRDVYLLFWSFALGHVNWPGFIFQHAGIPCSPARRCDWHQCPFLGIGNHCILYFEAKKQGRLQVVKSYSHENFFVYYCLDLSMDGSISGRSYHPAYWGAGAIRHQDAVWDFADLLCNAGDCNHMLYFNKLCSG